jgi:dTDP-4-dehydrorhamnose 3,5-epimerase
MIFTPTPLGGAWTLDVEPREDERGFFARTFCRREFEEHGLDPEIAQCSLSVNAHAATLRGMHYQYAPHAEAKLVRCTRGAIHDVIVDLRPGSPSRGCWFGVDLTADNRRALYVPQGFSHGFQTLVPDSEVAYQISEFYSPGFDGGLRWDDPALGITWPDAPARVISERDLAWPLLGARDLPDPTGPPPGA